MKKQLRLLLFLAVFAVLVCLLSACDFSGGGNTSVTTITYAPVTTGPDGSEPPLSDDEYAAFYGLVDLDKLSRVQLAYYTYYVGTYRTVEDCAAEIEETIRNLQGIRTVVDSESATGLYIDLYARAQGDYYGYYYPPSEYSSYTDDLKGEYTGIGVSVSVNADGYAEILNVFPGSPAEEVGMMPGDLIVEVEGEDFALIGYQNAINRIRGKAGTAVNLTIEREGVRIRFNPVRRKVTEVTVESRMMDGNIGYIRIISFNESTYEQFVAAHRALEAEGAVSYVFDVRYNPGGTLTSVVAILEYILPEGPIVHLNYKHDVNDRTVDSIYDISSGYMDGEDNVYYANHAITKPMVVLANGSTASAGELFTSALNDYGVATVIGEKTYGKGVGQSQIMLGSDKSALVITVFYYDPPTSPNYNGVGILPDLEVSLSEEAAKKNLYKLTYAEDAQLQAAVAALAPAGVQ